MMEVRATERSGRLARDAAGSRLRSFRVVGPLVVLLAVSLSGCGDKPPPQAASAAPPVTVAQPTKRTVTDWDEFTGRFDAVEEVQVRARVGGFVTSVEFRDGAFVNTGDLLYVIDSRPFEAVAEQADGQVSDARARAELAKRELDRALTLNQTQAVSAPLSISAARRCRRRRPRKCRPRACSRRPSSISSSATSSPRSAVA